MLRHHTVKSIQRRTLTDLEAEKDQTENGVTQVKPMNIVTYKLTLQ